MVGAHRWLVRHGVPALVLAPMDGVTDALMRQVLTEREPFSFCVSEFVRVNDIPPSHGVFIRDIPELKNDARTPAGAAVVVQILGGNPDRMAKAAEIAVASGAQAIDINFGCPAPTVNRHDGGATLLKFPERIEEIVRAVRCAVPSDMSVSAKLRLGWDDPSAIMQNAERAQKGGASWITIHGRTKMQGYTPPAYWKPIGEVRKSLSIPVVANGELWHVDDLKRCQDESGCEHFMIGRGALSHPGLINRCAQYLGLRHSAAQAVQSNIDWYDILTTVAERSQRFGESERRTLSRLKSWLNYACKRGSAPFFNEVKRIERLDQFLSGIPASSGCSLDIAA